MDGVHVTFKHHVGFYQLETYKQTLIYTHTEGVDYSEMKNEKEGRGKLLKMKQIRN
jgi:hypothetical protein